MIDHMDVDVYGHGSIGVYTINRDFSGFPEIPFSVYSYGSSRQAEYRAHRRGKGSCVSYKKGRMYGEV